jgi:hypothetical protein
MPEKSSNPLGLAPSTWVALAVAVMGIFALKQYPFQDTRPTDLWVPTYSHTASEDQDVEARLWQDPLSAVETARKVDDAQLAAQHAQDAAKVTHDAKPADKPAAMLICSEALAERASAETSAKTSTKTSAKTSAQAPATRPSQYPVGGVHSARHLCESINKRGAPSSVLVVGAIVSGAPYAADIETRRRTRYAVLAGLYRSGYMPVNNQHVGYVHLAEFYKDPTRANDLAAFEWFVSDVPGQPSRPAYVLLLWLDQDGFRVAPVRQFSTIADGLLPSGVQSLILGPADSDGLRAIAEEYKDPAAPAIRTTRQINIYSPSATAADDAIVHGIADETVLRKPMKFSVVSVHLYRTIATDSEVAKVVAKELADRNIDPKEIAIVAERDTLYGRSMGQYFKGCANPPREDPGSPTDGAQSAPLCLTYLKGLDGIGPPPPKQAAAPNAPTANEAKTKAGHANAAPDASTGPRQLDYLRRMGAALIAMQGAPRPGCRPAEPNDCEPRYIKAIGVLGTDIYDKLLVLQELRPMFPDVVFFTFGLDARYTDDENLPWTRQLLVGSSLGLSLRWELQGDIPAFRDGYQATTFYSTLLALHRASLPRPGPTEKPLPGDGLQWTKRAMVFEIGRKEPLDLNIDGDANTRCQFDDNCPSLSATRTASFLQSVTRAAASWLSAVLPILLWIMLRAAFGRDAMHRRFGSIPVTLTGVIVVLALAGAVAMRLTTPWGAVMHYLTRDGSHMPVPIADGASHWGKEVLEACLIPLIITLLIRGQRKLTSNAEKIRGLFGFVRENSWLIESYGAMVRKSSWRCRAREWIYFPVGYLSNDRDKVPLLPDTSELESLIARYLYRGVWHRRWARVLVATTVFILVLRFLEWLGFSAFSGVPWVLTQASKHGAEGRIAFFCFTFMQVLIFWVIDAILLTRAFLLDVARDSPEWPKETLKNTHTELGLPIDLAPLWLSLRLIARRTRWVSGFIWYPSLVIAGMFAATFTFEYGQYRFDSNPVTLLASVALIVAAVVGLRQAAESWRSDILQKLAHRRLALLANKPSNADAVAQVQVLNDLVTQLHDGAFAPYSEQPLVRAVLLPAVTFAATAGFPFLHVG